MKVRVKNKKIYVSFNGIKLDNKKVEEKERELKLIENFYIQNNLFLRSYSLWQ